jgi:hypothetical protein
MPAKSFFLGTWKVDRTKSGAFPLDTVVTIAELTPGGPECKVSWTVGGVSQSLRGVEHDGTRLVGWPARHESSDSPWNITISQDGTGSRITCAVIPPGPVPIDDHGDGSLAGTWGADAQPPGRFGERPDPALPKSS